MTAATSRVRFSYEERQETSRRLSERIGVHADLAVPFGSVLVVPAAGQLYALDDDTDTFRLLAPAFRRDGSIQGRIFDEVTIRENADRHRATIHWLSAGLGADPKACRPFAGTPQCAVDVALPPRLQRCLKQRQAVVVLGQLLIREDAGEPWHMLKPVPELNYNELSFKVEMLPQPIPSLGDVMSVAQTSYLSLLIERATD